jgi:hypothetical protein
MSDTTSHRFWLLHFPYPDGTWRGLEKSYTADDLAQPPPPASTPMLFETEGDAQRFAERFGVVGAVPVQVALVTPLVRRSLDAASVQLVEPPSPDAERDLLAGAVVKAHALLDAALVQRGALLDRLKVVRDDRVLLHELNEAAGSAVTSLQAQVERLQRTIAVERGDAAQAPPGWRRSPWRWPEGDHGWRWDNEETGYTVRCYPSRPSPTMWEAYADQTLVGLFAVALDGMDACDALRDAP